MLHVLGHWMTVAGAASPESEHVALQLASGSKDLRKARMARLQDEAMALRKKAEALRKKAEGESEGEQERLLGEQAGSIEEQAGSIEEAVKEMVQSQAKATFQAKLDAFEWTWTTEALREQRKFFMPKVEKHGLYTVVEHYGLVRVAATAPDLFWNHALVVGAVRQNWYAMMWIPEAMLAEGELVLAAAKQDWRALEMVPPEAIDARTAALTVSHHDWSLERASEKLRSSCEISKASVRRNWQSLHHTTELFRQQHLHGE